MRPAAYEDIDAGRIPEATENGVRVKAVAGTFGAGAGSITGPVTGVTTQPVFFDVKLDAGVRFEQPLPRTHNTFVYVFEGELAAAADSSLPKALSRREGGVFGAGDGIVLIAGGSGARFLLLSAAPIGEPVVQYGPFVMNTREEIDQAVRDYQSGQLVASGSSA